MFEARADKPLDSFIENTGIFTRLGLENYLSNLGIYSNKNQKTPRKTINRDVLKYLRKNYPEFEKLTKEEVRENKDKPVKPKKIDGPDVIKTWYKKLLKTGKTSDPKFKTSLKIEIYTFEDNDSCKFDSLLQGVIDKVPEISYIDDGGYSSTFESYNEPNDYIFPLAYLIVESGKGTYFYNGVMTLKDQNEGMAPC